MSTTGSPGNPTSCEEYRKRARKLRKMAESCGLPEPQADLLMLAQRYERLANHLETADISEPELFVVDRSRPETP